MVSLPRQAVLVSIDSIKEVTFTLFMVSTKSKRDFAANLAFVIKAVGVTIPAHFNYLGLEAASLYDCLFGFVVGHHLPARLLHVSFEEDPGHEHKIGHIFTLGVN